MIGEAINPVRKDHAMQSPAVRLMNLLTLVLPFVLVGQACGEPVAPSAPPAATPITLNGEMRLSDALKEVRSRAGVVIEDKRDEADPLLKLNLDKAPFWQAVDTLADKAGARVVVYPRDGRIVLVKREVPPMPVCYAGPYRVGLKRVGAQHDLETGTRSGTAILDVCWEAHLPPLLMETRSARIMATPDKGAAITVPVDGTSLAPVDGRYAYSFEVQLPTVPRTCQSWKEIRGEVTVIAPTQMLGFSFGSLDVLAKAMANAPVRTQQQQGITCQLTRIELMNDRWVVDVLVDCPKGGDILESYQTFVVISELALVSKDRSKKLVSTKWNLGSATLKKAKVTYEFPAQRNPGDWDLTYRTPADLKVMALPFSFKDVSLP
jgi:hypothetical protein